MTDLAIETAGLTRHFEGVRAVDDLSLCVTRGSVYAFLGPNGAGKTTTIRMLLGLTRPDRGEIRLFGETLTRSNRRVLLRRIGAMVESPSLYPHLTGYENLQVTQGLIGLDRSSIERVLRIVRLETDAHRLVKTYSHGMRQRLGIALALLAEPDLLILDEPTNGLDPVGIREIRDLIRGFPTEHGITVFLSSHLLAEVEQIASRVGIIGHGRLLFGGTLVDLRSRRRERVVIEVDHPQLASSVLRQAGFAVERTDESGLTVELPQRADIARAAEALIDAGLSLYQLRTVRASLEDLFLDLTSGTNLGLPSTEEASR
ncbi:MAG TPA: ABC transporter ATP-binding protein [Bryobacteraceae bacterium]|jgi:ABC-2 type transport system ATP-binding protein|nr:ABC transporter ATP-binding protein [Bryobacteraceae bacterium]